MDIWYIIAVYKTDIFSACITKSCVSRTARAHILIQIDQDDFIRKSALTVKHDLQALVGRGIID